MDKIGFPPVTTSKRLNFLSNKRVTCDFCGLEFLGNLNENYLIMCYRCVIRLCSMPDCEKLKFLTKHKGDKEKEYVIKSFIREEVLYGTETKGISKHPIRSDAHKRFFRHPRAKVR